MSLRCVRLLCPQFCDAPSSRSEHRSNFLQRVYPSPAVCRRRPRFSKEPYLTHKTDLLRDISDLLKNRFLWIPNEVTVALMTPPANLGSKTSQEAYHNHTTILHFGGVQSCHKTRSPNPLLYLIYACNNWILKPSTQQAHIFPVIPCAPLYSIFMYVTHGLWVIKIITYRFYIRL